MKKLAISSDPTMPGFRDPETYRDILDALQIGVSVLDLQRTIVFWSDGAEQVTGYSRIDVLGHSCLENILPQCNQISCQMCVEMCPIATALRNARPMQTMGLVHHRDGHRAAVRAWAIPLRDKHGLIIGLIQTFENEFAVAGPDLTGRSMRERGCLDEMTGLPNQALMQSQLREKIATFAELKIPFGVVYLEAHDLVQFRARYGQEAFTSLLQVLARTLRNTVWPADFVGRWSESGFLVILSGCGEDALQAVSEHMLRMMTGVTIDWWGEQLSVGVSLGRAGAVAGDTLESLLHRAQHGIRNTRRPAAAALEATAGNRSSQR
jgi:diguanylate cyclase (GGDEF)-like protein/PAS domain S-box-containing protein